MLAALTTPRHVAMPARPSRRLGVDVIEIHAQAERIMEGASERIRRLEPRKLSRSWRLAYRTAISSLCRTFGEMRRAVRRLEETGQYERVKREVRLDAAAWEYAMNAHDNP